IPHAEFVIAALEIVEVVSRRNDLFNSAASSGVSGGMRRVLTCPACGALVITANAHCPRAIDDRKVGSITRKVGMNYPRKFFTTKGYCSLKKFCLVFILLNANNFNRAPLVSRFVM